MESREPRRVKLHVLKLKTEYFDDVMNGNKSAELRIYDRDFHVGDLMHFTDVNGYEFPSELSAIFEKPNLFVITHILDVSEVLKDTNDKYVMLSIKRL